MDTVAMTQEQFDALMDRHEEYLRRRAEGDWSGSSVQFHHADLREVNMEGRNFDSVNFTNCSINALPITHSTKLGGITLYRCEVAELTAAKLETLSIHIDRGSKIWSMTVEDVTMATVRIFASHITDLSIQRCNIMVRATGSWITLGAIENCTGFGISYDRVEGDTFLHGNTFDKVRLRGCHDMQGTISLPMWNVYYMADVIQIGCQLHHKETWRRMPDAVIENLAFSALEWWAEWKEIIFAIVDQQGDHYQAVASQMPSLIEQDQKLFERFGDFDGPSELFKEMLKTSADSQSDA